MKPVYFSGDIRKMDEQALAMGATIEELTFAAGNAIADAIARSHPACSVLFFCGPGNNGADGLAAARLFLASHDVTVFQFLPEKLKDATKLHREKLRGTRALVLDIASQEDLQKAQTLVPRPDVVVDALLGTGSTAAPAGLFATAVDAINEYGNSACVISLDVPTGTDVDGGNIHTPVVHASSTIAITGYKPAHLLFPAAACAGSLLLVQPTAFGYKSLHQIYLFTNEDVAPIVRDRATHKGSYGCLLVVAGSRGFSGAGEMCTQAALRSGCGTLVLCSAGSTVNIYRHRIVEAMTCALPEDEKGSYGIGTQELEEALKRATACALGPGMGAGAGVIDIVRAVLLSGLPTVLDADALNTLARHGTNALTDAKNIVVTPHPRELSRLMDEDTTKILRDPIGSAMAFAKRYGCICVLKMATTVIASPERTAIVTSGCAGMAKGGSGDVLTGCLGSLLAQGLDPFYAACLAAHVCGLAGELAQQRYGMTSMLPTDTVANLPKIFKRFEQNAE
jgi:NAD(P)H-hydrate epimerase